LKLAIKKLNIEDSTSKCTYTDKLQIIEITSKRLHDSICFTIMAKMYHL